LVAITDAQFRRGVVMTGGSLMATIGAALLDLVLLDRHAELVVVILQDGVR